MVKYKSHMHQD